MKEEFCRKLAFGGLIQGYFHNLRGTLHGIYLNLQLLIESVFEELYNKKRIPGILKDF